MIKNPTEQSNGSVNLVDHRKQNATSRRGFQHGAGGAGAFLGMAGWADHAAAAEVPKDAGGNIIPGFENGQGAANTS